MPCARPPGFIYTRWHGSDRPDATPSSQRSPCQSNGPRSLPRRGERELGTRRVPGRRGRLRAGPERSHDAHTGTWRSNDSRQPRQSSCRSDFNPVAKMAVNWTRSQLANENMDWLAALPQGPLEAEGVVLVHGAFQDEDEYVFTPTQALEGLLDSSRPVTFYGHTHHQGGFAYQDSQLEVLQVHPRIGEIRSVLRIEAGRRYLLNPGSVGQPRDSDPRAGFAIADLEHQVVEFWRVPYDVEKVQERMRNARLPEPLVHRLSLGR